MAQDTIPGITVTLTENPLHAKVTLSESAKREFTYRFALKQMEDMAWEVRFRCDEAHKALDPKRALEAVEDFTEFEGHDKYPEGSYEFWEAFANKRGLDNYIHALNEEHGGDCTAVACSCIRCWAESLAGLNTFKGGKHMGASISGMFAKKSNNPQVLEAIQAQQKRSEEYWEKIKLEDPARWESAQESSKRLKKATEEFMDNHRKLLAEQNGKV